MENEQKQENKELQNNVQDKVQEKKINKYKVAILILIIFIIMGYFISMVVKLVKNPSNTFAVSKGTVSKEETQTGFIVRDEKVVENNTNKSIVKIKQEGERTAKGNSVFRYSTDAEKDLEKQLTELDKKIQESLAQSDNTFSSDKKMLETQIQGQLDKVYKDNNNQNIKEYKKQIDAYILKKAKIVGDLSPAGSYIKKLLDDRSEVQKKLEDQSEYVNSPDSGIVSYRVDGLEKVITPTNFANLNKEFLEKLNIKTGQTIASSDNQCKIINNYNCYIIFNSKSNEAKAAKSKDNIKIRLQNNQELNTTIENIIDENDGSKTIAIKLNQDVDSLIEYRKISFDIIWWKATGFRIPNSSITTDDKGINYVVRNRNGYLDKMAVKILKQNDEYTIVDTYTRNELLDKGLSSNDISNLKTITLYDKILLKP